MKKFKKIICVVLSVLFIMSLTLVNASAYTSYSGSGKANLTKDQGALCYGPGESSVCYDYTKKVLFFNAKCMSYVFPQNFGSSGCTGGYIHLTMSNSTEGLSDSDYTTGTFDSNYTNVDVTVKISKNAEKIVSVGRVHNSAGTYLDQYTYTVNHADIF